MSLSAYLAKNYLSSSAPSRDPSDPSTRPKKRRKKDKPTLEPSLIIADDEDLSLRNPATNPDDEDRPIYDQSHSSAEFRKSKKNNWQALATSNPPAPGTPDNDALAADRILVSAAAEQSAYHAEIDNEDAPAIVTHPTTPKMSSGIRAGLQTAADSERLEAEQARKKSIEEKALKKSRKTDTAPAAEETVYRDATGRRIDISIKRAEARALEIARLKAEQKEKDDAMGDVQRAEKSKNKEDLADAKFLTLARGEDDEEMNDELRGRVRWDDPMAGYMAAKSAKGAPMGAGLRAADTKPRRKEYTGAAPPNRYGVRPGWRWDGVDRGNGFEKEWFQARGAKARNRDLEYQWQMDE